MIQTLCDKCGSVIPKGEDHQINDFITKTVYTVCSNCKDGVTEELKKVQDGVIYSVGKVIKDHLEQYKGIFDAYHLQKLAYDLGEGASPQTDSAVVDVLSALEKYHGQELPTTHKGKVDALNDSIPVSSGSTFGSGENSPVVVYDNGVVTNQGRISIDTDTISRSIKDTLSRSIFDDMINKAK